MSETTDLPYREQDVFVEGEEHALRTIANALREQPNKAYSRYFKDMLHMAGYAYPCEDGTWVSLDD